MKGAKFGERASMAMDWRRLSFIAVLFVYCFGLYACGTAKEAKQNIAIRPLKFSTLTFGQLKLKLPISMVPPATDPPLGSSNLTIRSQTGKNADIHLGTLDNFEESMGQYVAKGILDDSIKTFDEFFNELVNLTGTQNYPNLQKIMEIDSATAAKKYTRDGISLYRFDFAKEKHVYIVFSNPKYVAEIYYLKGAISDVDFDAIAAGIRS